MPIDLDALVLVAVLPKPRDLEIARVIEYLDSQMENRSDHKRS